jgi:hypothetical protein
MNDALALALYSGSALIPLSYLICTGFRGPRRRPMLVAFGFHALITVLIIAYSLWCRSAGYREWYWYTALHIPTNFVFLCIYLSRLFSPLPSLQVTSPNTPHS